MPDNIYGSTWTTAANTQVGSYPYINLSQTEAGHMDMKDDTPGNESMRRQHGTSGTYYARQHLENRRISYGTTQVFPPSPLSPSAWQVP